jgi:DNA polymerase-3 subunit gamma/tau
MPWAVSSKTSAELKEVSEQAGSEEKKNLTPESTPESSAEATKKIEPDSVTQVSHVSNIEAAENRTVNLKPESPQSRPAGFSIKDAMKERPAKTRKEEISEVPVTAVEENSSSEKPQASFTEELMKEKFKEFVEELRVDKPRMFNALKDQFPILGENFEVIFEMNNTSLQDVFNKEVRIDLIKYLRRELNNVNIQINIVIKPAEPGKSLLYTSEERYEYLSKKNPELSKFKQQLNLDFD